MTRNSEIGNTPVWFLPNVLRPRQNRDTKFATNVYNEMLMNSAKCQGCSFYHFWVIKGKPTGEGGIKWAPSHTHTHTQIRLKQFIYMHLKGLITHFQKIVLFIMLWFTVSEILGFEVDKFCWIPAEPVSVLIF